MTVYCYLLTYLFEPKRYSSLISATVYTAMQCMQYEVNGVSQTLSKAPIGTCFCDSARIHKVRNVPVFLTFPIYI